MKKFYKILLLILLFFTYLCLGEKNNNIEVVKATQLQPKFTISITAYKDITKVLQEKELLRQDIYTKAPEDVHQYLNDDGEIVSDVTLDDLIDAFQKYYQRKLKQKPLNTKVTINEISVSSRRHDIKRILKDKRKISFFELFPVASKEYIVATFLAILEMAKNKELWIKQDDTFKDIVCEVYEGE